MFQKNKQIKKEQMMWEGPKPNCLTLELISDILVEDKETIAVAESVTAGQLQLALSGAHNAMQFFQGGITTYNLDQKIRHLKVDKAQALACNCVSEDIAIQMATNVAKLFNSDWGIGITGYASPIPEKNIYDLFACYAFCYHGEVKVRQTVFIENTTPAEVKQAYSNFVLSRFSLVLTNHSIGVSV